MTLYIKPKIAYLSRDTQLITKMDPYVIFKIGNDIKRTKTIPQGGKMPKWDDIIIFTNLLSNHYMDIKVMDEDVTYDDIVGQCQIDLTPFIQSKQQKTQFFPIFYKKKPAGKIQISIQYQENGNFGIQKNPNKQWNNNNSLQNNGSRWNQNNNSPNWNSTNHQVINNNGGSNNGWGINNNSNSGWNVSDNIGNNKSVPINNNNSNWGNNNNGWGSINIPENNNSGWGYNNDSNNQNSQNYPKNQNNNNHAPSQNIWKQISQGSSEKILKNNGW